MRITKKKLRTLIREIAASGHRAPLPGGTPVSDAFNQLTAALLAIDPSDRDLTIYDLIDQLEGMTR